MTVTEQKYLKYPSKEQFFTMVKIKIPGKRRRRYRAAIKAAYHLAREAHRGQLRDDGEDYYLHVVAVAWILMTEVNIKSKKKLTIYIIAALLHDMIEDTYFDQVDFLRFIFDQISSEIVHIVFDVTKKPKNYNDNRFEVMLNSSRLATKILKAPDRLHNLRTLHRCSPEKIAKKIKETREIILPWLEKDHHDPNLDILIAKIKAQLIANEDFLKGEATCDCYYCLHKQ